MQHWFISPSRLHASPTSIVELKISGQPEMTKKKSQGVMTKLALGTSFSPMPNPVASALTETVCRPTSITTLKLISYNTMSLIQNLILLSSEILTLSYYPVFIHKSVTLSWDPVSALAQIHLQCLSKSFAILVRLLLSSVFNRCIKRKLERLDPLKGSLPDLSMWKAFLLYGVTVL